MKRIHIVACGPRTGTTLLTEMMSTCFQIDLCTIHEDSIYVVPSRQADICLTKNPQDILAVNPILRLVPDLFVIYMLRDPRDIVVSRHGRSPDKYWTNLKLWQKYSRFGQRLQSHPRFITIQYEDLVARPDEVQQYLMSRMPFLNKTACFSSFHTLSEPSKDSLDALGGVRPVSADSIGNWKRHLPRVAGQIKIHGPITEDLITYGYEQDSSWETILDGIKPDMEAGYHSDNIADYRFWKRTVISYPGAIWVMLGHYRPTSVMMRYIQYFYKKSRATLRKLIKGR